MKAILKFNLPEDREEYESAINGSEYKMVLRDLDERMRRFVKDGVPGTYQEARDMLHECLGGLAIYD